MTNNKRMHQHSLNKYPKVIRIMRKELEKSESLQSFLKDPLNVIEDKDNILGIIYKATCLLDNRVYIGETTKSLEDRKRSHETDASHGGSYYFQNALHKHGFDNFLWEILDVFHSKEECQYKEKEFVWLNDSYKDRNKGYNLTEGGEWGDTISHHPDKENIIKRQQETARNNGSVKSGIDHHLYGKNGHCHGIVNYAKGRKGKSNTEVYGFEKAQEMENNRKLAHEKNKHKHKNMKGVRTIRPSSNFLKFIISYAYFDKSIESIMTLSIIFENLNKNYSRHVIQRQLREQFPKENKELNSLFKSRISSGERNPRHGCHLTEETKKKQSLKKMGKPSPFRIIKDTNKLIDLYFDDPILNHVAKHFNVSYVTIRNELKRLDIPTFQLHDLKGKQDWFSVHKREDFYVK